MDHEAEDTHLCRTAVVELNGALRDLGLLIKGVPSEVNGTVAEVTHKFRVASDIFHDEELKETNETHELEEATRGDSIITRDSGPAVANGIKRGARVVNVSRKMDAGTGDDVTEEGKLTDTAVLDLDITEAVETLLVSARKHAKRIEETDRGLGSELRLKGIQGGGCLANLGRGEGGSRASKKGGDDKLHDVFCTSSVGKVRTG